MTALSQYERLESTGLWRPDPASQRRDVLVCFGNASLVISAPSEEPITHWSLAAIVRVNPKERPAIYTPSAEGLETIEIADPDMIEAIETVRRAVIRRRPHRGRLRGAILLAAALLVAGLGFFWLPGALVSHAARIAPESVRQSIGTQVMAGMVRVTGEPCTSREGQRALDGLGLRVLASPDTGLRVVESGVSGAVPLPGRLTAIGADLVEDHDGPEVLAGYLLAAEAARDAEDPLQELLRLRGPLTALRLLTTGQLRPEDIRPYAEGIASRPLPALETEDLLERFSRARVPSQPYAYAVDITGEKTLALIEADPMAGGGQEPLLSDSQWVALQGICGN